MNPVLTDSVNTINIANNVTTFNSVNGGVNSGNTVNSALSYG